MWRAKINKERFCCKRKILNILYIETKNGQRNNLINNTTQIKLGKNINAR